VDPAQHADERDEDADGVGFGGGGDLLGDPPEVAVVDGRVEPGQRVAGAAMSSIPMTAGTDGGTARRERVGRVIRPAFPRGAEEIAWLFQ
jgi:hypothetical protein